MAVNVVEENAVDYLKRKLLFMEEIIDRLTMADPFNKLLLDYQRATVELKLLLESMIVEKKDEHKDVMILIEKIIGRAIELFLPLLPENKRGETISKFRWQTHVILTKTDYNNGDTYPPKN